MSEMLELHQAQADAEIKVKRGNMLGLIYASMMPGLQQIAIDHGYALAVHGSMRRDFDLIAVPWVDGASDGKELIDAIANALSIYRDPSEAVGNPEPKPYRRMAWIIPLGSGLALDISVMPTDREFRK